MRDNRLHNDCDGGQCCACQWDKIQAMHTKLQTDKRAWFNPDIDNILTQEEYVRLQIEDAVRSTLPKYFSRRR